MSEIKKDTIGFAGSDEIASEMTGLLGGKQPKLEDLLEKVGELSEENSANLFNATQGYEIDLTTAMTLILQEMTSQKD